MQLKSSAVVCCPCVFYVYKVHIHELPQQAKLILNEIITTTYYSNIISTRFAQLPNDCVSVFRMYRRTSNMAGLTYPPAAIAALKVLDTVHHITITMPTIQ